HAYRRKDLKEFNLTAADLHNPRYVRGYSELIKHAAESSEASSQTILAVLQILGEIGPQASDSVRTLKLLLKSEQEYAADYKAAAQATLEKISPTAAK
ncbi:MAG: hypothetical protein AB7O26_13205, partial [Planctomycetaceae bacterium]